MGSDRFPHRSRRTATRAAMPTLPWSAIDTVLLDMDGTLLDLHFDNHFWLEHLPQRYAERNGLSRAEADAVLEPLFREHAGQLNWYCLDFWSRELDLSIRELKHFRLRPAAQPVHRRQPADPAQRPRLWCRPPVGGTPPGQPWPGPGHRGVRCPGGLPAAARRTAVAAETKTPPRGRGWRNAGITRECAGPGRGRSCPDG